MQARQEWSEIWESESESKSKSERALDIWNFVCDEIGLQNEGEIKISPDKQELKKTFAHELPYKKN